MVPLYGEKTIWYAQIWHMPHGVIHNGMNTEWNGGILSLSPSKRDLHTQGRRKPMEHEILKENWWTRGRSRPVRRSESVLIFCVRCSYKKTANSLVFGLSKPHGILNPPSNVISSTFLRCDGTSRSCRADGRSSLFPGRPTAAMASTWYSSVTPRIDAALS